MWKRLDALFMRVAMFMFDPLIVLVAELIHPLGMHVTKPSQDKFRRCIVCGMWLP